MEREIENSIAWQTKVRKVQQWVAGMMFVLATIHTVAAVILSWIWIASSEDSGHVVDSATTCAVIAFSTFIFGMIFSAISE